MYKPLKLEDIDDYNALIKKDVFEMFPTVDPSFLERMACVFYVEPSLVGIERFKDLHLEALNIFQQKTHKLFTDYPEYRTPYHIELITHFDKVQLVSLFNSDDIPDWEKMQILKTAQDKMDAFAFLNPQHKHLAKTYTAFIKKKMKQIQVVPTQEPAVPEKTKKTREPQEGKKATDTKLLWLGKKGALQLLSMKLHQLNFTDKQDSFLDTINNGTPTRWHGNPEYLAYMLHCLYNHEPPIIKPSSGKGVYVKAQQLFYFHEDIGKKVSANFLNDLIYKINTRKASHYLELRQFIEKMLKTVGVFS